jgi:hypothetical protein
MAKTAIAKGRLRPFSPGGTTPVPPDVCAGGPDRKKRDPSGPPAQTKTACPRVPYIPPKPGLVAENGECIRAALGDVIVAVAD